MTDSLAAPELVKSFTDRILRLRDEEDALKSDIRDVYSEAKANGLDKTILGKLVNRLRAEAKDGDKLAETEELLELYLSAYRAPSRAHPHVHARAKAVEPVIPPHDPETGEVEEPAAPPAPVVEAPADAAPLASVEPAAAPAVSAEAVESYVPPTFLAGERKSIRPHCQRPENCGGSGREHCYECNKVASSKEAA